MPQDNNSKQSRNKPGSNTSQQGAEKSTKIVQFFCLVFQHGCAAAEEISRYNELLIGSHFSVMKLLQI